MNIHRWITTLFSFLFSRRIRGPKPTPPRNRPRLGIERLEDRLPPAVGLASYGQLPLSFEANQGQTAAQVQYLTQGSGYSLFLTSSGAVLSLTQTTSSSGSRQTSERVPDAMIGSLASSATSTTGVAIALNLVGANPNAAVTGLDALPGTSNYFIGNDPSQWHTGIANFSKVEYQRVYPGVNLVYYGNQQQLEYDYQVAPGANPSSIRFAVQGADSVTLDAQGNLVLHTATGDVLEKAPVIYQQVGGVQKNVTGQFVLLGHNEVGFKVGAYDASLPLVIDPVLVYSSYLGGSGTDIGYGIAVDGSGNAYVTGYTGSTDFPTSIGAFQTSHASDSNNNDVFIAKLNATGTALVYSTYLGGNGNDVALSIAVDGSGDAYVTGYTHSTNFPTTAGAIQSSSAGNTDGFIAKLNASGAALVYSTYLGGSGDDGGIGIAVDGSGDAYVTGDTYSLNFPTSAGAFQTTLHGNNDAFITKLNASGARVYSTFLGGIGDDTGYSIAVDSAGDAYVTGDSYLSNFPTTPGAFQTSAAGDDEAFVAKLNANGSALVYSTFLGGNAADIGTGIALDGSGNAYVIGYTFSTNFPTTAGAFQTTSRGNDDAFVTKLNASGTALVYSTYLGGSGDEQGFGIALDSAGNAYLSGQTSSTNFPTISGAFQTTIGGGTWDAFVAKLNAVGTGLTYSSYLGGSGNDYGNGIALDSSDNAYLTGYTASGDFPATTGAFQTGPSGGLVGQLDAFVTKLNLAVPPTVVSVIVNGGPPQYTDDNGNRVSLAGQNSVVEQLLVTFNEAVTLDPGAFTITNDAGSVTVLGGIPTPNTSPVGLNAPIPVPGSGGTQFILTFLAGSGVNTIPAGPLGLGAGTYVMDGVYTFNTDGSKVHANGLTAADNHTGFWALFGSVAADNHVSTNIGDGTSDILIDSPDAAQFKIAFNSENDSSLLPSQPYDPSMDCNLSGVIGSEDAARFKHNFGAEWIF